MKLILLLILSINVSAFDPAKEIARARLNAALINSQNSENGFIKFEPNSQKISDVFLTDGARALIERSTLIRRDRIDAVILNDGQYINNSELDIHLKLKEEISTDLIDGSIYAVSGDGTTSGGG